MPATAADFADLQAGNFQKMIASVTREFGQLRVVATTLRTVDDRIGQRLGRDRLG